MEGNNGEKWDNCISIINKIYLKIFYVNKKGGGVLLIIIPGYWVFQESGIHGHTNSMAQILYIGIQQ